MNEPVGTPAPAPEPVAPKKKNTTWIIIAVVVVVLCCCCAAAGYLAWTYGDQILNQIGIYY